MHMLMHDMFVIEAYICQVWRLSWVWVLSVCLSACWLVCLSVCQQLRCIMVEGPVCNHCGLFPKKSHYPLTQLIFFMNIYKENKAIFTGLSTVGFEAKDVISMAIQNGGSTVYGEIPTCSCMNNSKPQWILKTLMVMVSIHDICEWAAYILGGKTT